VQALLGWSWGGAPAGPFQPTEPVNGTYLTEVALRMVDKSLLPDLEDEAAHVARTLLRDDLLDCDRVVLQRLLTGLLAARLVLQSGLQMALDHLSGADHDST
jgi:hypothetical protein